MHDHSHADVRRPNCPFCGAAWSDAMLDQFDAMSGSRSCACCAETGAAAAPLPSVIEDLCCAACGRAIYLKPETNGA